MTPGQVFLLALVLLYLADCFLLVPRRGFAFMAPVGRGRYRLGRPSSALGNDRAGLVFAMPVPPLGRAYVAGLWPISLAPHGFASVASSCVNPGLRPAAPSGFVAWRDLKQVGWEGRVLMVNGRKFLKLASPQIAREYARLLRRLAELGEAERPGAIRRWCEQQLSARRVRRRVRVFERATAGLRLNCNLLFLVTFVVVPLMYWKYDVGRPFLVSLGVLALLVLWIGIEFWCLHKKLYPEQGAERFQLWMLVGVMPQYSIRAVDELSKGFLAAVHPLAVAEVFLREEHFVALRDAVLRDLEFPAPQVMAGEGAAPSLEVATQFRNEFEEPAIAAIASRRSAALPKRRPAEGEVEEGAVHFCPRCLMPYEAAAAQCVDCGGVEVRRLDRSPRPTGTGS